MIGEDSRIGFIRVGTNAGDSLADIPTDVLQTRLATWEVQRKTGEKALVNSAAIIEDCRAELVARGILESEVQCVPLQLFNPDGLEAVPLF